MIRLGGIQHHVIALAVALAVCSAWLDDAQAVSSNPVSEQPIFHHLGVRDGLPSNSVQALAEDHDGYIWVGTNQGLSRFDGYGFRTLRLNLDQSPELGSNLFQSLFVDSWGRRWAAPENGGLLEFSAKPDVLRHFGPTTHPQLPGDSLWAIEEDCHGRLLLGYFQSGLLRFDPDSTSPPRRVEGIPTVPVTALATKGCEIWAGTYREGIFHVDSQGVVRRIDSPPDAQDPLTVLALRVTPRGLLVGARNDLLFLDDEGVLVSLRNAGFPAGKISVTGIQKVSAGRFLLATTGGLVYMDWGAAAGSGRAVTFTLLSDNRVAARGQGGSSFNHVLRDRAGAVWVGTLSQGLLHYQPDFWDGRTYRLDLPAHSDASENRVRALLALQHHPGLLLASLDRGISFLNLDAMQLTPWPGWFAQQRYHSILQISQNEVWLGTASGLLRVRLKAGLPREVAPEFIEIGQRSPGFISDLVSAGPLHPDRFWVVDQGTGLLLLNGAGDVLWSMRADQGLPSLYYHGIEIAADGTAWAFGERGLLQLQIGARDMIVLGTPAGLPERAIYDIEMDGDVLWLAHEEGVEQFRADSDGWTSVASRTVDYGDTRLIPQALQRDAEDNLWIGSMAGLGVLRPDADQVFMLENPVDTIGQHIRRETLFLDHRGVLFVGSQDGLISLDTRAGPPPAVLQPNFSGLKTPSETIWLPDLSEHAIHIGHDHFPAELQISPMGQPNASIHEQHIRMAGADESWRVIPPDWQLTIPELDPGRYQFQLSGPDLLIQQVLDLVVEPPMVASAPVKGSALLLSALLLFWMGRGLRIARRRRQLLRLSRQAEGLARQQSAITSAITASLSSEHVSQALVDKCQQLEGVTGACLLARNGAAKMVPPTMAFSEPELESSLLLELEAWLDLSAPSPAQADHDLLDLKTRTLDGWLLSALPVTVGTRSRGWLVLVSVRALPTESLLVVANMLKVAVTAFDNARLYRRSVAFAEEADRAVNHNRRWMALVSHEIRGPLHGLMGTLNQLRSSSGRNQSSPEAIEVLDDASRQILRLVNEVLDEDAGVNRQFLITPDVFDLRELTEQLIHRFAGVARDKGLGLYRIYAAAVASQVFADRVRLDQVLSNLLNNALKFSESGHVCLSIQPGALDDVVHFAVSDTGPGIAKDEILRVQEPYQRGLRGAGQPDQTGAGLGLSIVRDLLLAMDSRLHVSSEPDQGSVFEFSLAGCASDDARMDTGPSLLKALKVQVLALPPLAESLAEMLDYWSCEWCVVSAPTESRAEGMVLLDERLLANHVQSLRRIGDRVIVLGTEEASVPTEVWRRMTNPITESRLAAVLLERLFAKKLGQG